MKALPFKIPKTSEDTLIVQEDKGAVFYDTLHQHEEIQISVILAGEGNLIVGDRVTGFVPGDVLIFGSQVPHVLKTSSSATAAHMVSVFFGEDSFGEKFFKLPEFKECQVFFEQLSYGVKITSAQQEVQDSLLAIKNCSNRLERFTLFLRLLQLLTQVGKETISSSMTRTNYSDIEGKRMARIFELVMHESHRDISLKEVSSLANLTPNAFCRYFKKHTNKTFFEFLVEVRIENSCRLLVQEKEMTIAQVSYTIGFTNLSHYNRKFKASKGMTPSQFRKQLHNPHFFQ